MAAVTQQLASNSSDLQSEPGQRLQQVVLRWRGTERGQSVADLHEECRTSVGAGGQRLVPDRLVFVRDLDAATLKRELTRRRLLRSESDPRFRGKSAGRFDAALVPAGAVGQPADRWVLLIEETLPLRDQVGLYAIAVGYGLLNRDAQRMGRPALLDARDGFTHRLLLSELRLVENARQDRDRRVLEAYPLLAELLRPPETPSAHLDRSDPALLDRLGQAGWRGPLLTAPFVYTDGRIYVGEDGVRRGRRLRIDGLLRAEASLPIALVHSTRPGEDPDVAVARLAELNWERFRLPFAYVVKPEGVEELDWTGPGISPLEWVTGGDPPVPRRSVLADFPRVDELLTRWLACLNLSDDQARDALLYPYEVRAGQYPRHYQEVTINRVIAAVLQARRGLRVPRVLLTLATGTGKTKVAFQIAWKLKRVRAVKNVMFLTDRDYLLTQAMDNEFAPFRDARARIRGELRTAQDVFFTTYQALAGSESSSPLYKRYPKNYFDLVIVDECHRGSAQDESNWRKILDHFDTAVQIGMTATPLRDDNVDTYNYFGRPLVVYSLRQGINDGFLAPYRVRRVLMDREEEEQETAETAPDTVAARPEPEQPELPVDTQEPSDAESADDADQEPAIRLESSAAMVARTDAIAAHLARTLRATDPKAKTIVFCVDQAHAGSMLKALEREFPAEIESFKARGENFLERIVSEEGTDGKRALGKFSDPEKDAPVIVTTSRLLSTGVDIPPCKNIVIARPIGSIVEFKQIIGRGTRLDDPRKMWFTIIDYAGTTKHFYDPEFDGDPQFVELDQLDGANESAPAEETDPAPPNEGATPGHSGSTVPPAGAVDDAPSAAADATPPAPDTAVPAIPGVPTSTVPVTVPVAADARPPSTEPAPTLPGATVTEPSSTSGVVPVSDSGAAIPAGGVDNSGLVAGQSTAVTPVPKPVAGTTDIATGSGPIPNSTSPPTIAGAEQRTRPRDGARIVVVGEFIYELGPDGRTLRETPYMEYTREAIGEDCPSIDNLRERWLRPELRSELQGRLADAGVELEELAAVFDLADRDPIDVVAHALFRQPVPTRRERIERLKERHLDWLNSFKPDAREVLDLIIDKYIAGEANDVTDTGLLKVPPLSQRGTFLELAQRFGNGAALRDALAELSRRLYQD